MKNMLIIILRVICMIILFLFISLIVFSNVNRMKGEIFVEVNEEEYPIDCLECKYIGKEVGEKIICESKSSGLAFKNSGSLHGMYEYCFEISNGEFNIKPKILVFKTNWWKIYNIKINVNIYQDSNMWNADVSADVNGYIYHETFYDVENNEIEYRVE